MKTQDVVVGELVSLTLPTGKTRSGYIADRCGPLVDGSGQVAVAAYPGPVSDLLFFARPDELIVLDQRTRQWNNGGAR